MTYELGIEPLPDTLQVNIYTKNGALRLKHGRDYTRKGKTITLSAEISKEIG